MTDKAIRKLFGAVLILAAGESGGGCLDESEKVIIPTPTELRSLAETLIDAYDPRWFGGFGLFEFMTAEETRARRDYWETPFRSDDGVNCVIRMLEEKAEAIGSMMVSTDSVRLGQEQELLHGTASIIQRVVGFSLEEYDTALAKQILRRRGENPFEDEYTYPLEPTGFPIPVLSNAKMQAEMKNTLSLDPIMKELDEEFGRQGNPFNNTIDKIANGLIVSGGCGGYYAGDDLDGYPLFVTAAHCISGGIGDREPVNIPGRKVFHGIIVAIEGDAAMIRGSDKVGGMTPLLLGEKSPWGLAVSPLHSEAELIRYSPGWGNEYKVAPDQYSHINRIRCGYSGAPLFNSLGHVTGLISSINRREGMAEGWGSYLTPVDVLKTLYKKAGVEYLFP